VCARFYSRNFGRIKQYEHQMPHFNFHSCRLAPTEIKAQQNPSFQKHLESAVNLTIWRAILQQDQDMNIERMIFFPSQIFILFDAFWNLEGLQPFCILYISPTLPSVSTVILQQKKFEFWSDLPVLYYFCSLGSRMSCAPKLYSDRVCSAHCISGPLASAQMLMFMPLFHAHFA